MATVWMPLPDSDFDVTESAVPWRLLTRAGHRVVFASEGGGRAPVADQNLLRRGPLLSSLAAAAEPQAFYREMEADPGFRDPIPWGALVPSDYDALVLPGGHAPGMRQYLGSAELQAQVAAFWSLGRPVAAICHGVLVLARAVDPATGQSVLRGRRTTCLPKYMERTSYWLTRWGYGRRYRTYDAYVEDEVRAALGDAGAFERGPRVLTSRGTDSDDAPAFVVEDGVYVSARWPGDAYLFARRLLARIASPAVASAATRG